MQDGGHGEAVGRPCGQTTHLAGGTAGRAGLATGTRCGPRGRSGKLGDGIGPAQVDCRCTSVSGHRRSRGVQAGCLGHGVVPVGVDHANDEECQRRSPAGQDESSDGEQDTGTPSGRCRGRRALVSALLHADRYRDLERDPLAAACRTRAHRCSIGDHHGRGACWNREAQCELTQDRDA